MQNKNLPPFNERCKQVIAEARALNPDRMAMIGCLATRLVMTQNTVALHLQRMRLLLEEMEEDACWQK